MDEDVYGRIDITGNDKDPHGDVTDLTLPETAAREADNSIPFRFFITQLRHRRTQLIETSVVLRSIFEVIAPEDKLDVMLHDAVTAIDKAEDKLQRLELKHLEQGGTSNGNSQVHR